MTLGVSQLQPQINSDTPAALWCPIDRPLWSGLLSLDLQIKVQNNHQIHKLKVGDLTYWNQGEKGKTVTSQDDPTNRLETQSCSLIRANSASKRQGTNKFCWGVHNTMAEMSDNTCSGPAKTCHGNPACLQSRLCKDQMKLISGSFYCRRSGRPALLRRRSTMQPQSRSPLPCCCASSS